METQANITSRAFAVDEVEEYVSLISAVDTGSGTDGVGHSHAFSKSEPLDIEAARDREITRWSASIDEIGWRRAWGLFDRSDPVGYLYLAGGALRSELHRVNMGMGVLRTHRRQGGGAQLLEMVIDWAHEQPSIDWIDLGVFSDNPGARALYQGHGFEVLGRTSDRFRVDGVSLDEISMTRNVSRINE